MTAQKRLTDKYEPDGDAELTAIFTEEDGDTQEVAYYSYCLLYTSQGEVTKLLVEDGKITGVKTYSGATYNCKAVDLCTGTYLKARCIYGDVSNYTGPNVLQAANYLTDSLKELGIEMFRFKTGTPARIAGNTIDYSKMEEQFGDERVVPVSYTHLLKRN